MTIDAIATYFVARMVPAGDRERGIAIGAIVAVAVAVAIFGIAQVLLDPDLLGFFSKEGQFGEGYRISSIIGNPNMAAAVIGLTIPFALFGSRHLANPRLRWAARGALVILLWALLLTFSRGAWISVGVAALIGTLLLDWRSLPYLIVGVVLAWGAATVMPRDLLVPEAAAGDGGGGAPSFVGSTGDRIDNLADPNDTRARFLRDGLRVIEDNFWLGVGPGEYGGAAAAIMGSRVYGQYQVELYGYRTVHDFWLHLLGESGVLGTAVFLTMIVGLLIRFVLAAWRSDGLRFVILAGTATMLMVATLHSVTEMIFEGNMPVLIVWLVVGIASVLARCSPSSGAGRRRLRCRRSRGGLEHDGDAGRDVTEATTGRGFGSRIASDSFVYGLGGIANQAVAILLVPIYARVLGPSGVGVTGVLNSIISLSLMLVGSRCRRRSSMVSAGAAGHVERAHIVRTTLAVIAAWLTASRS